MDKCSAINLDPTSTMFSLRPQSKASNSPFSNSMSYGWVPSFNGKLIPLFWSPFRNHTTGMIWPAHERSICFLTSQMLWCKYNWRLRTVQSTSLWSNVLQTIMTNGFDSHWVLYTLDLKLNKVKHKKCLSIYTDLIKFDFI